MTDTDADANIDTTKAPAKKVARGVSTAERDFTKATVVVNGSIPAGAVAAGMVVIAEARGDDGQRADVKYGDDADFYLAYPGVKVTEREGEAPLHEPEEPVNFGVDPSKTIFTMGENLYQGGFGGFSRDKRYVHVGPGSSAYAAANLAYLQGARDITIVGLTDDQKDKLRPAFDRLSEDPNLDPELKITLT